MRIRKRIRKRERRAQALLLTVNLKREGTRGESPKRDPMPPPFQWNQQPSMAEEIESMVKYHVDKELKGLSGHYKPPKVKYGEFKGTNLKDLEKYIEKFEIEASFEDWWLDMKQVK